MEHLIALIALTAMEIVLGIDNIVFIALQTGRLPAHQQASARQAGLAMALGTRILLLLTLTWIMGLTKPIVHLAWLEQPLEWLNVNEQTRHHILDISWRDMILLSGGLFLLWKSVHEIHEKIEGDHGPESGKRVVSYWGTIVQIAILDIIFSLDSVITAVGMAKHLGVMVAAVVIAVGVMLVFSGTISRFVEKHATLKILALSFLILIGVMLVAEGIGTEINKGFIYFAMAFALGVECLNLRASGKAAARESGKT